MLGLSRTISQYRGSRATRSRGISASCECLETRTLASADTSAAATTGRADRVHASSQPAREISNIVYTNLGGAQHLDLYLPAGPTPPGGRPVVLALPGGGWRWVRRESLGQTVSKLTNEGYVVAVADYAFASSKPGSHIWPTDFADVRQAVRWLKGHSARYGINTNEVAVWGESAGAHLANLLGTDPNGPLAGIPASNVSASVAAVIDFYGPTDLAKLYQESATDRPFLSTFLGGSPSQYPDRYQAASPIDYVSKATPPILIYQGTTDTANLPDQAAEFDQALTAAAVPHEIEYFQGIPHGFRLKPEPGVNLLPQILDFLDASFHHPDTLPV